MKKTITPTTIPVTFGVPYSMYTDKDSNVLLTPEDKITKSVNASHTSSINFIDHVIQKINDTPKHAEKIKLLAIYKELYGIDDIDYEYIQKKTDIMTEYKPDELISFRKQIATHPQFLKFLQLDPKQRSKNAWRKTKLFIMNEYTNIELTKHFDKVLKDSDVLGKYVAFNDNSDLQEMILQQHKSDGPTADGTQGFFVVPGTSHAISFKDDDLAEKKSLQETITEDRSMSIVSKAKAGLSSILYGFVDWATAGLVSAAPVTPSASASVSKSTIPAKVILMGYYKVEKNGMASIYGEYFNLWAYIDYHLNAMLKVFLQRNSVSSAKDFWSPSELKQITSADFEKLSQKVTALATAVKPTVADKDKLSDDEIKMFKEGGNETDLYKKLKNTIFKDKDSLELLKAMSDNKLDGAKYKKSRAYKALKKSFKKGKITKEEFNRSKKEMTGQKKEMTGQKK